MPDSGAIIRRLRAVPATTVPLRAERRRISRELKEANRSEMLRLAHELIDASLPRFVAYELVLRHEPTLNGLTVAEVDWVAIHQAASVNWSRIHNGQRPILALSFHGD